MLKDEVVFNSIEKNIEYIRECYKAQKKNVEAFRQELDIVNQEKSIMRDALAEIIDLVKESSYETSASPLNNTIGVIFFIAENAIEKVYG